MHVIQNLRSNEFRHTILQFHRNCIVRTTSHPQHNLFELRNQQTNYWIVMQNMNK